MCVYTLAYFFLLSNVFDIEWIFCYLVFIIVLKYFSFLIRLSMAHVSITRQS